MCTRRVRKLVRLLAYGHLARFSALAVMSERRGYRRIVGELKGAGIIVSATSVR
jgi:hypothetical protein